MKRSMMSLRVLNPFVALLVLVIALLTIPLVLQAIIVSKMHQLSPQIASVESQPV